MPPPIDRIRNDLRVAWRAKIAVALAFLFGAGLSWAVSWAAIDHRYRDKIAEYEATILSLTNDLALAYDLTPDNPRRPEDK